MADQDEAGRRDWAKRTAIGSVDGVLSAAERSTGPHPTPDQIALLREIARRALWHLPGSRDEARELVRYIDLENLKQPHPGDEVPLGVDQGALPT